VPGRHEQSTICRSVVAQLDHLAQPRRRAGRKHALEAAAGVLTELRGVEADEPNALSQRFDGVAIDDVDAGGHHRIGRCDTDARSHDNCGDKGSDHLSPAVETASFITFNKRVLMTFRADLASIIIGSLVNGLPPDAPRLPAFPQRQT
jgi:hypothetical protein